MYKIVRFFSNSNKSQRIIMSGLTLKEAQAHCNDPETASSICTSSARKAYTRRKGEWFDGYISV